MLNYVIVESFLFTVRTEAWMVRWTAQVIRPMVVVLQTDQQHK
jgi:hypothetical protein